MTTPTPTVDEVAKRLGLKDSSLASFRRGEVVTDEREASNEKDLSLLVAVVFPASLQKTWDFISQERVVEIQDTVLAQGRINLATFELEGFQFDHGTQTNLGKFNMSMSEAQTFANAIDKESAFKGILSVRAKAYWDYGLKGMEPYQGANHNIPDDLETANGRAVEVLLDPKVREEITTVPSKSQNPDAHFLTWSIVQGHSMTSIVLSHMLRYKKDDQKFIGVTRKFYSATDFDCSLIMAGAIPINGDSQSAFFYINHTFTSAVAGFGGGTKRMIGRKMMKGALVETMKKAQKALA